MFVEGVDDIFIFDLFEMLVVVVEKVSVIVGVYVGESICCIY